MESTRVIRTIRKVAPSQTARDTASSSSRRKVLNVGSGLAGLDRLHPVFQNSDNWQEVRLDVDPRVKPDIVCSVTDLTDHVGAGDVDAIWSSHTLEHLYEHEVAVALAQFRRVLAKGGFALIRCPDLQAVIDVARSDGLETVVYVSPAGPVTALDMLYGFRPAIASGNTFMAHRTGLTDLRLGRMLIEAGFAEVRTRRIQFDLWALATVDSRSMGGIMKRLGATGLDFTES